MYPRACVPLRARARGRGGARRALRARACGRPAGGGGLGGGGAHVHERVSACVHPVCVRVCVCVGVPGCTLACVRAYTYVRAHERCRAQQCPRSGTRRAARALALAQMSSRKSWRNVSKLVSAAATLSRRGSGTDPDDDADANARAGEDGADTRPLERRLEVARTIKRRDGKYTGPAGIASSSGASTPQEGSLRSSRRCAGAGRARTASSRAPAVRALRALCSCTRARTHTHVYTGVLASRGHARACTLLH